MKTTIISLSFLFLTLGGASVAYAGDAFLGAQVGLAHWATAHDSANEFGYGGYGGYRFHLDSSNSLGFEAGYVDFGRVHRSLGKFRAAVGGDAVTVGPVYRFTFLGYNRSGGTFLQARAGYMRWFGDANVSVTGYGNASASDDGDGWYAGAGIGHYFTPQFEIGLNYEFHRVDMSGSNTDIHMALASAEFRF